jgi:hypothetical protein
MLYISIMDLQTSKEILLGLEKIFQQLQVCHAEIESLLNRSFHSLDQQEKEQLKKLIIKSLRLIEEIELRSYLTKVN